MQPAASSATTAASWSTVVLRAAAAQPHQVDRAAGCYIVDDDYMIVHRWLRNPTSRPAVILPEFVARPSCMSRRPPPKYDDKEEEGPYLVDSVRKQRAEGVIFAATSFCDPGLLERPMLRPTAEAARHPADRVQVRGKLPGQMQPSANRLAPSPTPSNSGANDSDRAATQTLTPSKTLDGEAEGDDRTVNYDRLAPAKETGAKVAATFVPGNLERIADHVLRPRQQSAREVNAIQNGMRKVSGGMIMDAEKAGHRRTSAPTSSDIGMMGRGNIGPTVRADARAGHIAAVLHRLLHLHEVVRAAAPRVQVSDGDAADPVSWATARSPEHDDFVVKQLKEEVIPMFEKVSASSSTSTVCANI